MMNRGVDTTRAGRRYTTTTRTCLRHGRISASTSRTAWLFPFDQEGKLAGERIYYDRGSVLQQVGLYHPPQSFLGRMETLLAHPVTVAWAYVRKLSRSRL